jgi:membrane-bound lytic murein transglycosylase B
LPDWTWLKGQAIQESGLNPNAVSPVGAAGLMQFMPPTWSDVSRAMGWRNVDPRSPQHAILAGAFYMRQQRDAWTTDRPIIEKQRLALASFNAGLGSILAAQKLCRGARDWSAIALCLPGVTGAANAKQTTDYVRLIPKWRAKVIAEECAWTGHRGGCSPIGITP